MSAILAITSKSLDDVAEHHFCSAMAALRWRGRGRRVERLPHGWLAVVQPTAAGSVGSDIHRDEAGNVAACHGRLYDLADLYCALGETPPPDFQDRPAMALLAAYRKWGREAFKRWVGELSFVIWDEAAKKLIGGRDHLGTRPLFYYNHGGMTAFCTDSKALLTLGGRVPEPDPVAMHRFLCLYSYQDERTFFMRIKRVMPAHYAVLEEGKLKLERYWRSDSVAPASAAEADEAFARFQELMERSVSRRLIGVRDFTLEGPRDRFSSLLAVVLGRSTGEVRDQASGSLAEGLPPALASGQFDLLDELDRMNIFHDEPVSLSPVITSWILRNEARNVGGGVQLNPMGARDLLGQEVLSLSHLLKTGRWLELMRRVRDSGDPAQGSLRRTVIYALHHALAPLLPVSWLDTRRSFRHKERFPWMNSTLTRLPLERNSRPRGGFLSEVHRQIDFTLTYGILPLKLHYEDRHSGILGVEARFPFLDRDLVEFALALPPEKLFGPDSLASLLKERAPRMVGRQDRTSPASRLQAALDELWTQETFHRRVGRTLEESQLVADGWLRGDKLLDLQRKVVAGRRDLRDHLWRVLTLEGWYRQRWSSQATALRKPALRIASERPRLFG